MPWIQIEEGAEEIQSNRRRKGDGEVSKDVIPKLSIGVFGFGELAHDDVDRGEGGVDHDYTVDHHTGEIQLLRSLRSIPHTQYKLRTDQQHTNVLEEIEDVFPHIVTEGVNLRICERAGDKIEGEVEVGQGEEGED